MNDPNWRLPEVPAFRLSSPDAEDGGRMPQWARSGIMGAGGEDVSPALEWSGAPDGTQSYVVTVYDPDAPTGSGFWHWAVHGIPASVTSLPRNAGDPDAGLLPDGAITQPNEVGLRRFLGAAPPAGHGEHRYVFTVSALGTPALELDEGATPAVLGFTLRDHLLGRAQLTLTSETPAED